MRKGGKNTALFIKRAGFEKSLFFGEVRWRFFIASQP